MGPFVPYSSTPAVDIQTTPRSSPTVRMAVIVRLARSRMVEPPVSCAGPRDAAVAVRRNASLAAQRPLPWGQRPHNRCARERLSRAAGAAAAQRRTVDAGDLPGAWEPLSAAETASAPRRLGRAHSVRPD